jgi:mannosyltransferase PIG-V
MCTRLLVWAAAMSTIAIFGQNPIARPLFDPGGITISAHSRLLNVLLAPAARWDSVWYLEIAKHGYFKPAATNFFPLYPALIALLTPLLGNAVLAGLAISAASLVLALVVLYRLTSVELDEPAAAMTVLLVAVFPTSLFLSAVYPTALFLLLTVGAAYAARNERWMIAGICGGLAAALRSNGVLLLALLVLMYLYGPRGRSPIRATSAPWWRPRFRLERNFAWLALAPAGLAAYLGFLMVTHGAPLAPFHAAHLNWDHSFGPPLASIAQAFGKVPAEVTSLISGSTTPIGPGDPLSWQSRNLIDVFFLLVAVAAVIMAWSRVPRTYVIYAILQLVLVTSFPSSGEPMIGLPRYMLAMFPLFMGAGGYLVKRRAAARATLAVSAALLVVFSGLWGYWALVP